MATRPTGRPPGRPPDPTARDRIIAASWDLFLAGGVEHVTVEAIARAAGVSKVTVYKHFSDKNEMFDAGIRAQQDQLNLARAHRPEPEARSEPLRTQLIHFGVATMHYVSSQGPVDFYAILSGELRRRPELARIFYDAGPGQTRRELAQLLAAAQTRGELKIHDPLDAAEELFGMWQGFSNFQLALGIDVDQLRDDLTRRVQRSVDTFLAAHGAPPGVTGSNTVINRCPLCVAEPAARPSPVDALCGRCQSLGQPRPGCWGRQAMPPMHCSSVTSGSQTPE